MPARARRQLGTDGPAVFSIGYGAMVLSPGIYGRVDDDDSISTLRAVLDAGIDLIDTARLYGDGHNETLVGRAIAGRRDEVTLATKGGLTGTPPQMTLDASPAALRRDVEASLTALGTDHIDLYYLHAPDPDVPVEDSIGEIASFVAEGKVRSIGVSNMDLDQLRRAHAVHPIAASQDQYSLFYRVPEQEERVTTLREQGIALVAYSPLANGALAGARPGVEQGDMRSWMGRFTGKNGERVAELSAEFARAAERAQMAPAALALAWLLAQGDHVIPIPGTRRAANLQSGLDAASLSLDHDLLAELDATFPPNGSIAAMF